MADLGELWNWLPAFRAVAETEHLPSAAERLHVVPSALSRSIRLLEDRIGAPLFARSGRRLVLNPRGRALLAGLSAAMRGVERSLQPPSETFEGELRVSTLGVLTNHLVLPALLALSREHPLALPVMRNHRASEANHRLLAGDLDLAFSYDAVPLAGVTWRRLGELSNAIYCGRGHPLFKAERVSRAQLFEHPFSVPSLGDRNTPMDNWPVEVPRKIAFRIELLTTNLEVCRSGAFVTVLPDVVALPFLKTRELRRLPFDLVPPTEIYGACRTGDEEGPLARLLFADVAARARALEVELRALRRARKK